MSWSRLQSASSGPHSAVASLAVAYGSNLTAGSKLIAVVTITNGNGNQTTTCTGVSDGNGNSFTQLADAPVATAGFAGAIYTNNVYLFAMDTPAGDAGTKPTITAALTNSAGYGAILIQEVSGLLAGNTSAMLDGSVAVSSGNGGTNNFTAAPASYSSTAANEYLVDIYGDDGNSTWSAPAGYTADANSLNANGIYASVAIGYKNSGNGSESGSWSVTQPGTFKNWGVILVAFQLAALTITTTGLAASPGASYSQALQAAGGTPGYTWSISSGSLPAWASLNTSTGVISGTAPSSPQATQFTAKVTDSLSNTATQQLVLSVGPYPAGSPSGGPWALAFNDDFSVPYPTPHGTGPNPAVWSDRYIYGDGFRVNNTGETDWNARGYYGHSVSGSVLSLTATYQNPVSVDPTCASPMINGQTGLYTSGVACSFPYLNFTYGYVEARTKQVFPAPAGYWPAFWHVSLTQWPPEIDTSEFNVNGHSGVIHAGFYDLSEVWHESFYATDGNWHVYGMRLDSSHATWFLDGIQVFQVSYTAGALPWHVLLDMATYGDSSGTGYPASYQVDYVRFWGVQGVPAQPSIASLNPATGIPSGTSVAVSFAAVPGATSYRVTAFPRDQFASSGNNFNSSLSTPLTATGSGSPLTVSGLTTGKPYCFTVAAINATGYSIESLPTPSFGPSSGSGLSMASFP